MAHKKHPQNRGVVYIFHKLYHSSTYIHTYDGMMIRRRTVASLLRASRYTRTRGKRRRGDMVEYGRRRARNYAKNVQLVSERTARGSREESIKKGSFTHNIVEQEEEKEQEEWCGMKSLPEQPVHNNQWRTYREGGFILV